MNCTKLKDVSFNKGSTTYISGAAFENCSSLKELVFYSVSLGTSAFNNCDGLKKITFMGTADGGYGVFSHSDSLSIVVFSSSGYKFGAYTFYACPLLKYVYFPVTENMEQFVPKTDFKGIHSNAVLFVADGMKSEFLNEEYWKNSFKSIVTLPPHRGETFTSIMPINNGEVWASAEIVNEEAVYITSVDDIADDIKDLSIPRYIDLAHLHFLVTGIGDSVFSGSQMTALSLNDGLKYIGKAAFANCSLLESVIIPKTVMEIFDAFVGCENLNSVSVSWLDPTKVTIDQSNFLVLPENAVLNVPAGTLEKYKSHVVWGRFPKIIESSPISLGCIDVLKDSEALLPVYLRTDDVVSGIQFRLTLPDGFYVEENDDGILTTNLTERTEDMFVMGRRDPNDFNSYNFVLLSLIGKSIEGNSGDILEIKLNTQDLPLGIYETSLSDVYVSTSSFETKCFTSSISEITILDTLPGDCNGDGRISVVDVSMIINHILKKDNIDFNIDVADINKDGRISIVDVTMITNIILSK